MNGIKKVFVCMSFVLLLGNDGWAAGVPAGASEALPEFYDLRLCVPTDRKSPMLPEKSRINPIRMQGYLGTCWAHAAVAAVESNMYLQLQKAGIPYNVNRNDVNLSEWYLAWVARCWPTEVEGDVIRHFYAPEDVSNFRKPLAEKVYTGGFAMANLEFMTANNASLAAEPAQADDENQILDRLVAPRQYAPQAVHLKQVYGNMEQEVLAQTDGVFIKQQLMRNGAGAIALNADQLGQEMEEKAFFVPKHKEADHEVNIIGWDDTYDFSTSDMTEKPKKKGAWIIRNSWGKNWADQGYAYLSYEDQTAVEYISFEADMDLGAFSHIDSHEDNGVGSLLYRTDSLPLAWFADGEHARDNSFLKRVGFYTYQEGVDYTIEIRTGADTPEKGRVVYTQQGRFGQDGSPAWSGYRTVDLHKYVFLTRGEHYTVVIRLSNPNGKVRLVMAPQEAAPPAPSVTSYLKVGDQGRWYRAFAKESPLPDKPLPNGMQFGSVIQREYLKRSDEAMGGDFRVGWLDDTQNPTPSDIYLGRAEELYRQDRLAPDRRTVSSMTADIAEDETYHGTIWGEGRVIKAGTGNLTLCGNQKYTGGTEVKEGNLYLATRDNGGAASVLGDVVVDAGAGFGGTGIVQGSVCGDGELILSAGDSLRVHGGIASQLKLRVQREEQLQTGQVLLTVQRGIPEELAGRTVGQHRLQLNQDHTQLVVE